MVRLIFDSRTFSIGRSGCPTMVLVPRTRAITLAKVMSRIAPSFDAGVRFFNTSLHSSAPPHQFQWRLDVSTVRLLTITSLTTAPSWTLIPNPLFEFLMTQLLNST